ncbi:MAG: hypothetical protein AAGB11_03145 [Pseudomonadota bacterium]
MLRDLDALMVLPPAPYDACEKVRTRAKSISVDLDGALPWQRLPGRLRNAGDI